MVVKSFTRVWYLFTQNLELSCDKIKVNLALLFLFLIQEITERAATALMLRQVPFTFGFCLYVRKSDFEMNFLQIFCMKFGTEQIQNLAWQQ